MRNETDPGMADVCSVELELYDFSVLSLLITPFPPLPHCLCAEGE